MLDTIRERIVELFNPLQLILFGSRARGNSRVDSDVDLLVVLEDCTDKRESAIQIRRCLADMPIGIDVVVTCPEEIARRGHIIGSVLRPALREGKVLFERSRASH